MIKLTDFKSTILRLIDHFVMMMRGLAPAGFVCLLLALVGLGAAQFISKDDAIAMRTQANTQLMSSFVQWTRAEGGNADIAFVGDSTCENGIEPNWLSQRLGVKVINLCTMAYAGPGGYGESLEAFLHAAGPKARVVVAMHGHFFEREAAWEQAWGSPLKIARDLREKYAANAQLKNIRDIERLVYVNLFFERLIDTPTEHASVSAMIGGLSTYRKLLTAQGFYYLTSMTPCLYCLPQEYAAKFGDRITEAVQPKPVPTPNAQFEQSVARMRESVARVGADRVYLMFMPFDDRDLSQAGAVEFRNQALRIAERMGLPASHVLPTPLRVPSHMLGDRLHFYRPGQIWFSDQIAPVLAQIIPAEKR